VTTAVIDKDRSFKQLGQAADSNIVAIGVLLVGLAFYAAIGRFDGQWSSGVLLAVSLAFALPVYLLTVLPQLGSGQSAPKAARTLNLVVALSLLATAMQYLGQVVAGDGGAGAAEVALLSALYTALALVPAWICRSSICLFISALSLALAVAAAADWIFDLTLASQRWALLVIIGGFLTAAMWLKKRYESYSVQVVNASVVVLYSLIIVIFLTSLTTDPDISSGQALYSSALYGTLGGVVSIAVGWQVLITALSLALTVYGLIYRKLVPAYGSVLAFIYFITLLGAAAGGKLSSVWDLLALTTVAMFTVNALRSKDLVQIYATAVGFSVLFGFFWGSYSVAKELWEVALVLFTVGVAVYAVKYRESRVGLLVWVSIGALTMVIGSDQASLLWWPLLLALAGVTVVVFGVIKALNPDSTSVNEFDWAGVNDGGDQESSEEDDRS